MNMPLVKLVFVIGGVILLIDALTSLKYVHDKRWFCQAVRVERLMFALISIIVGVFL